MLHVTDCNPSLAADSLVVQGRVALIGDAAGYVTKCSGEGIYFAAKSGRMCAEAIAEGSKQGRWWLLIILLSRACPAKFFGML